MSFTLNEENSIIPYTIYLGNAEDGNIYFSDTTINRYVVMEVPVNYHYSVEARYIKGGKTIVVYDGSKVKRKSYTECDSTCYYIREANLNLRLAN